MYEEEKECRLDIFNTRMVEKSCFHSIMLIRVVMNETGSGRTSACVRPRGPEAPIEGVKSTFSSGMFVIPPTRKLLAAQSTCFSQPMRPKSSLRSL